MVAAGPPHLRTGRRRRLPPLGCMVSRSGEQPSPGYSDGGPRRTVAAISDGLITPNTSPPSLRNTRLERRLELPVYLAKEAPVLPHHTANPTRHGKKGFRGKETAGCAPLGHRHKRPTQMRPTLQPSKVSAPGPVFRLLFTGCRPSAQSWMGRPGAATLHPDVRQ